MSKKPTATTPKAVHPLREEELRSVTGGDAAQEKFFHKLAANAWAAGDSFSAAVFDAAAHV